MASCVGCYVLLGLSPDIAQICDTVVSVCLSVSLQTGHSQLHLNRQCVVKQHSNPQPNVKQGG